MPHKKDNSDQNIQRMKTITDIAKRLMEAYDKNEKINLIKIKHEISAKHKLASQPKLVDIISAIPENYRNKIIPWIKCKPIRTASGIVVVAVMAKPHRCPHIATTGNICVYCPGGPDSDFEYSTQSYTGYEPTSMRAIRARYNPYIQTRDRLEQLKK